MSDRFVLIGHPVGHSVSPAIHGRAYDLLGIEASYGLVDCPDEAAVRAQVDRIRDGSIRGANVTVPWKQVAHDLADVVDRTARDLGVANVLARSESGKIVAYNTDASALGVELVEAIRQSKIDPRPRPAALVIGNGGAATAAVVSCKLAGIDEVYVTARRYDPEGLPSEWPRADVMKRLGAVPAAWWDATMQEKIMPRLHTIVQATSAGMKGAPGGEELAQRIPFDLLERCVAYDLVYTPRETPFLRRAREHGHFAVGGLGMLVGQAREALRIWLGRSPDQEALLQAAEEALAR